jgi:transcriptional regulator of acetoin/glycerol metabolism
VVVFRTSRKHEGSSVNARFGEDSCAHQEIRSPFRRNKRRSRPRRSKPGRSKPVTAAKLLGIGKTTLYRKLKEYGIGESVAGF